MLPQEVSLGEAWSAWIGEREKSGRPVDVELGDEGFNSR